MDLVQDEGPRPVGMWGAVLTAIVLGAAWAGTARAQDVLPPSGPSRGQVPGNRQSWQRQPESPEPAPYSLRWLAQAAGWYGAAALALGGVTLLSLIVRFYVRMSATADPKKLARSDPWVRAHLEAQSNHPKGHPTS
jgi:hypothetical protein